jgi:uncharacterized membrane protein
VEVAGKLGASYDSAAAEARRAIQQLERASSKALESAKRGADELMQALGKQYRWWFFVFVILAFVLGIGLGWECGVFTRPTAGGSSCTGNAGTRSETCDSR